MTTTERLADANQRADEAFAQLAGAHRRVAALIDTRIDRPWRADEYDAYLSARAEEREAVRRFVYARRVFDVIRRRSGADVEAR